MMGMLSDDYTARGKRMAMTSGEKSMNGESQNDQGEENQRVRMRDHEAVLDEGDVEHRCWQ